MMIGKTVIGKSFGGCVRYVMDKEEAEVLTQSGVRIDSSRAATQDFNNIRNLNKKVDNAVWHTSISFAKQDKVDNQLMVKVANDYLSKVGLDKGQYLVVRHNDAKHEHMHIVANRVGYDSKTVSDKFCKNRTARACDELEVKYGLIVARHIGINQKSERLNELKQDINSCIKQSANWDDLESSLKQKGIETSYNKQSTGRIAGVSFIKDGEVFKASSIDKSLSYSKISKKINEKSNEQEIR